MCQSWHFTDTAYALMTYNGLQDTGLHRCEFAPPRNSCRISFATLFLASPIGFQGRRILPSQTNQDYQIELHNSRLHNLPVITPMSPGRRFSAGQIGPRYLTESYCLSFTFITGLLCVAGEWGGGGTSNIVSSHRPTNGKARPSLEAFPNISISLDGGPLWPIPVFSAFQA